MKFRWWYGIVLNLILAVLAVSGAVFYVVHIRGVSPENNQAVIAAGILEIRDAVSGKVYGRWPLEEDGEFSIEFIHSVNQSPVRETFRVQAGMIKPEALRFSSFGAGMPSTPEEGQTLTREGDHMLLSGFSTSFSELNYIVGTVSDHLLLINGEAISLGNLCGKNTGIIIRWV